MKIYNISWLILVYFIVYGSEVLADSNKIVENTYNELSLQQLISEETNKQDDIIRIQAAQKLFKSNVNKQLLEVDFKQNLDLSWREAGYEPKIAKQRMAQSVLDLSLPLRIKQRKNVDFAFNSPRKNYLPNLFKNDIDRNNQAMQITGKVLKREEQELDKDTIVDGAGIDFRLIH